jgi:hypothetical protein
MTMDYDAEIAKLLEKALPLRSLDDDDPKKQELTGIVDEVNALREAQDKANRQALVHHAAPVTETVVVQVDTLLDLVKQAQELGITVDRRWSEATLRARIDEALAK